MVFEFATVTSQADIALCLQIRHQVFVQEQGVPVDLEIDVYDNEGAFHFLGYLNSEPVATARICVFDKIAKIQRVAVLSKCRGKGAGRELMEFLVDHIRAQRLASEIALDAQTYAVSFYEALGFVAKGDVFDDAGIPHIHMKQMV